jgi:hypothetical protein
MRKATSIMSFCLSCPVVNFSDDFYDYSVHGEYDDGVFNHL